MNQHDHMVKLMLDYFPDPEVRERIEILDLAAGTGLVGERLHPEGFKCMDATDYSEAMLTELTKKNIYRKSWQAVLGVPPFESIENVQDNSYDVIVMLGGFTKGHIDIRALYQAHAALKPGGLFINGMTERYTKDVPAYHGLDALFFDMEKQGKWKVILRQIQENEKWPGLFHVCRKQN